MTFSEELSHSLERRTRIGTGLRNESERRRCPGGQLRTAKGLVLQRGRTWGPQLEAADSPSERQVRLSTDHSRRHAERGFKAAVEPLTARYEEATKNVLA